MLKAFWPMGEGPNDRGLSRKHVFEQVHASLKRLDLEYIDIFYCHRFDPATPIEETLRTIDDLVRQGKILYAGVSEWKASQIAEALTVADRYLLDCIVVNQPAYNLFNRYIEPEIIPFCEKHCIAQVVFSPLAQGVLTGKCRKGQNHPEGSRATDPRISKPIINWLKDELLDKIEPLEGIAGELGITLSQLALAWVLLQPNVASAIIGASRPEQVDEKVKASGVELPEDVVQKIEAILER